MGLGGSRVSRGGHRASSTDASQAQSQQLRSQAVAGPGLEAAWTTTCMETISAFAGRLMAVALPVPPPQGGAGNDVSLYTAVGRLLLVLEQLVLSKAHCSLLKTALAAFNAAFVSLLKWSFLALGSPRGPLTPAEAMAEAAAESFLLVCIKRVFNALATAPDTAALAHLLALSPISLLASAGQSTGGFSGGGVQVDPLNSSSSSGSSSEADRERARKIVEVVTQGVCVLLARCRVRQRRQMHELLAPVARALLAELGATQQKNAFV